MVRTIVIGRIGQDVNVEYKGDKALCKFSIAASHPYKKDETIWYNCDVWGKSAENFVKICKKGSLVFIEGFIDFNTYNEKIYHNLHVSRWEGLANLQEKGTHIDIQPEDLPF